MTELVVLAWNFKLLECYRNLEKLSWNFVFIWILLWQTWKFLFRHTTYWYSLTKIWLMIIFLGTNSLGKPLSLARWYTMGWNNFWRRIIKFLKFMFSKKATKIEKIFNVDLTLILSKRQIDGENLVNFCGLLRKHKLYAPAVFTRYSGLNLLQKFKEYSVKTQVLWKSEHILFNCDMIGRTMWVLGAPSYSQVPNKGEDSNKIVIFKN